MSYNIDTIEVVSGALTLTEEAREAALAAIADRPEGNFLDYATLPRVRWCGDWSGHTLPELKRALTYTRGTADLALIWEGGDSVSGIRVVEGAVTEHKASVVLGDAEGETLSPSHAAGPLVDFLAYTGWRMSAVAWGGPGRTSPEGWRSLPPGAKDEWRKRVTEMGVEAALESAGLTRRTAEALAVGWRERESRVGGEG